MTLIIVTGEIDLSVASTLGLTSAVMGALWDAGLPIETIVPLVPRCSARCSARSTACSSPCSGCRRWRSRSARSRCTAGWRSSCSATPRSRLPGQLHRPGSPGRIAGHPDPDVLAAAGAGGGLRAWCCTPRPLGRVAVRHAAPAPTAARFAGIRVARHQVLALRASPACVVGAGRRAVDAALLQRPRRQRLRPGAGRRRGRAARRRLHLRRPRHAARRRRRRPAAGVAAERAAAGRRLHRGAHRRHRRCC